MDKIGLKYSFYA